MELKRIDHIGIVVPGFAEPAALLEALGLELGPHEPKRREPGPATTRAATPASS